VTGRETEIISPSGAAGREGVSGADGGRIGAVVRAGGVVLFPTESFYALGGDPFSLPGLEKVFRLKGRTRERTLLLLLDGTDRLPLFTDSVPEAYLPLMEHFWPGPLTLLFPANRGLPEGIVSPRGEVALRVPGSRLSRAVLTAAGGVLTGTSAHVTGKPPPVEPRAALRAFDGADLLVDGGTLPGGRVSTLLTLKAGQPAVLREGAVGLEEVKAVLDGRLPKR
jgi:L-threonylcarbamoyladenylate synthase